MKKLSLLIAMLILSSSAFADVYVLYDKQTNEIYSLSSADDAVQPKGIEKEVIKGELKDLEFTYPMECYTFKKGKIKLDMSVVEEISIAEEKARKKSERKAKIRAKAEKMAEEALIASGELGAEND